MNNSLPASDLRIEDALGVARSVAEGFSLRAEIGDQLGRPVPEDIEALRSTGLLGLMVPERLGGSGALFSDYARVAMSLAEGNGAPALVFNMHASITGALALTPEGIMRSLGVSNAYLEARDQTLMNAARGALYAVAMSERGAGSRLSELTTVYERVGKGFHISGSKTFVSGAGVADAYVVAARGIGANRSVSLFLVRNDTGVVIEDTWDSLGMRATGSNDLHLDVVVPEEALLGGVEGLGLVMAQLMPHWLVASYAAVYVGVARSAVNAAVEQVRARSLDRLPLVRARIGQADAAVAAAELVMLEACRHVDNEPGSSETNRWVWRAKLIAGDTAMQVAASMLEACGTSATRRGNPLERIFRDARCGALQPATSDVCSDWLGLATLGRNPDHEAEIPRW